MATVEYRDIEKSEQVDVIDFLFKRGKPYVAESALTPERILRYYEALVEKVPVKELAAKDRDHPYGLQSLQALVVQEPRSAYGWRKLENDTVVLERGLFGKQVSYQMQYLALQTFRFPEWEEVPHAPHPEYRHAEVLLPICSNALLVNRRKKLCLVEARWTPKHDSFWYSGHKPREVITFTLSYFKYEEVTWQDPRIMERIENGGWRDCIGVAGAALLALRETINAANSKARWLSGIAKDVEFAQTSIFHGR